MAKAITALAGGILMMGPLTTASAETPNTEKPMLNHMESAVTQPAKDVNLKKTKIPAKLLEVRQGPYNLAGLDECHDLSIEIERLNPLLGPDVDANVNFSRAEKRERSVSRVAGGILGGLIPFRGVVREVTGANASDRRYQQALKAGLARRSFLKGIAHARECPTATNLLALRRE